MKTSEIQKLAKAIKINQALKYMVDVYIEKTSEAKPLTGLEHFKDIIEKTGGKIGSLFHLLIPPKGWSRVGVWAERKAAKAADIRKKIIEEAEKVMKGEAPAAHIFNAKMFEKGFSGPFSEGMIEEANYIYNALIKRYGEYAVKNAKEFESVRRFLEPYIKAGLVKRKRSIASTLAKGLAYGTAATGGIAGGIYLSNRNMRKAMQRPPETSNNQQTFNF